MDLVGALVAWLSLGPGFDLAPVSVRWKMRRSPRTGAKMPFSTMASTMISPGRGLRKISQLNLHALSKGKTRLPRQAACPRRFCTRLLNFRLQREDFAVSEIGQRSGSMETTGPFDFPPPLHTVSTPPRCPSSVPASWGWGGSRGGESAEWSQGTPSRGIANLRYRVPEILFAVMGGDYGR